MYDPMVAKLIVWDCDREQATKRMLRALGEYEIEGLTTLIPFHQALLATQQWAKGETCRDLLEDKQWLKTIPSSPSVAPAPEYGPESVEQTYEVEVSGKRIKVELGEGVTASAPLPEQRQGAAAGAQKADLSALSAMLAQKWKSGDGAAESGESVRAGQVRSFKIVQVDLDKKRIDLELQP